MCTESVSEFLWGQKAKLGYLLLAAALLLLTFLGSREIWTQEHRWADIVSAMLYSHDFLHPSLNGNDYYDKPLLSYWLIAGISILRGHLSLWALRLPSALAGMLAIVSIYRLGLNLKDKRLGLLAGWLLLTTFYFIFWARTSSADMLNLAGSLFAVSWYFEKKNQPAFFNTMIFFLILALTALCKGLVGPVVAVLAIFPDIIMEKSWKKYLKISLVLSMVPAVIVYVLPFWASSHFGGAGYGENGLYEVYRENILRYVHPFDHEGPIYTYFIFLPVYLLPWTIFFIPALFSLKSRWSAMSSNSKWMVWSTLLLFLFFTLSGSRRSYYVLPIIPFAILMTADWILVGRSVWTGRLVLFFFLIFFLNFCVVQPWYYSQNGIDIFAEQLKTEASKIKPWSQWQVVLLDPESKVRFYLQLPPTLKENTIPGDRKEQTQEDLLRIWPVLKNYPTNVIFVSRKLYEVPLRGILVHYQVIDTKAKDPDTPIAFIPKR